VGTISNFCESMKIWNKASSPVSTTPVIITVDINDTDDNISPGVVDIGDKNKVANISANFRKNSK
jgi:hypothetical protein